MPTVKPLILNTFGNPQEINTLTDIVEFGDIIVNGTITINSTINAEVKVIYNEVSSVASGVYTTLLTYIVPIATSTILQTIQVSGENRARIDVLVDGDIIVSKRTNVTNLNTAFGFPTFNNTGYTLQAGQVLTVKVLHTQPSTAKFETTIQIIELT